MMNCSPLKDTYQHLLETNSLDCHCGRKMDSKRRIVKLLKRDAQLLEATELKEQELRAHFAEEIKSLGLAIDSQASTNF